MTFGALGGGVAHADPPQDNQTKPNDSQQALVDLKKRLDHRKMQRLESEAEKKLMADLAEADKGPDAFLPPAQQGSWAPVPTVGMGGLVPNARSLADYVMAKFPGVQSIGGVRADPLPDHPSGHAVDIMIGSDMGLGDAINADVQSQAGRFGVAYTMWRVANHFNHVHVTVS